ncbi:MAG: hypothetical protein KDB84_04550 [Flavobacteriales bacterium]|nr:hypothetical protein [Flavobacteriales bacterium]
MFRFTVGVVLCSFTSMLLAPFAVLIDFQVHKAQIEKELCVQRDVMDSMRTCHGECQLSLRFKSLEREAQSSFPVERISVRLEPLVPIGGKTFAFIRNASPREFPRVVEHPVPGVIATPDQVPKG